MYQFEALKIRIFNVTLSQLRNFDIILLFNLKEVEWLDYTHCTIA